MSLYLGLNLSHESSAAVLDSRGNVLYAISEERIIRVKNYTGFPNHAISAIVGELGVKRFEACVIGSHSTFDLSEIEFWYWIFYPDFKPSFDWISGFYQTPPGFKGRKVNSEFRTRLDLKEWVEAKITERLKALGVSVEKVIFRNHHTGHLVSGFGSSGFEKGLSFSLDAEGDGHSGAVMSFETREGAYEVKRLASIPVKDSLGYFYSAVTKRYNFKVSQHEGKITGLAALGNSSPALQYLLSFVGNADGLPKIKLPKSKYTREFFSILHKITKSEHVIGSVQELIEVASRKTDNYADLAMAGQQVLEISVLEFIRYFTDTFESSDISLSGGVFANVKLNEKIANLSAVKRIYIFPNMGDGGLSIGGVWDLLLEKKGLCVGEKYSSMYLGERENQYESLIDDLPKGVTYEKLTEVEIVHKSVQILKNYGVLGLFQGRMEFGPRALLNRSIIASPENSKLNEDLNRRLKRTEFMPFAPFCRIEKAEEVFDFPSIDNLDPFRFMTMTCTVKEKWRNLVRAVTHVDGSARPQLITRTDNLIAYDILSEFERETGIPLLVNTSFNIHEEPIIRELREGLIALGRNQIDALVTPEGIYSNKK